MGEEHFHQYHESFETDYSPNEDTPDHRQQHGFHEYPLYGCTADILRMLHNSRPRGGSQIPWVPFTVRINLLAEEQTRLADEHDIRPIIRFLADQDRIQRELSQPLGSPVTDYRAETHISVLIEHLTKFTKPDCFPRAPGQEFNIRLRPNSRTAEQLLSSLNHIPQVRYRNHTSVIEDRTIRDTLDLMAQIRSEELGEATAPIPAHLLPMPVLDALGRMACADWLQPDSNGYNPIEPRIQYPEPGLTGHLNLWGLTHNHLFTPSIENC